MPETPDRSRTLDELEGTVSGEPTFDSFLLTRCHSLRKKPIREFGVEDLRIMIGQHIGLNFLLPIAVEVLEANLLAEGDFYPGDLLSSILRVPRDFWRQHSDLRIRMSELLSRVGPIPKEVAEAVRCFSNDAL